jgi:hypothetical protein
VYVTAFLIPNGTSIAGATLRDEGSLVFQHLVLNPDGTFEVERSARREIFLRQCDERDVVLAQTLRSRRACSRTSTG